MLLVASLILLALAVLPVSASARSELSKDCEVLRLERGAMDTRELWHDESKFFG